jgi:Undecaprenyl-phosphate glucose phosphotransferase
MTEMSMTSVPRLNTILSAGDRISDRAAFISTQARPTRISPTLLSMAMRIGETAMLSALGLAVAALWVGSNIALDSPRYLVASIITAIAAGVAAHRLELFSVAALSHPLRSLPRAAIAWTTGMALLTGAVFLMKTGDSFSRAWLLIWYAAGLCGLVAFRYGVSLAVSRWAVQGRLKRNAIIFGAGPEGADLIAALEASESDVRICGVFDDRGADRIDSRLSKQTTVGTTDDLIAYCRHNPVDLLIVSLPFSDEDGLLEVVKKLWVLPVDIRLAGGGSKLRFHSRAYSFVGNVPLIDLFDKPLADWDVLVKGVFDRVVAAVAIVVLAPLMAAVALAIRLDSKGPILFCQKRLGFNNKSVDVLKFRSMYVDMSDATASRLVTRDDPRVTRVGRIIRKTSLDELPQLFNVLVGTLSLVGPRPHAVHAKAENQLYHEVVDGYFARHKVKPGITGWAQINGWRGETDTTEKIKKRVEHDLYYVENWSLLFDILILIKTPFALLKSENAY